LLTVNTKKFSALTREDKKKVIEHELRHVPQDKFGEGCLSHDVEDFKVMLEKYGIDYVNDSSSELFNDDSIINVKDEKE